MKTPINSLSNKIQWDATPEHEGRIIESNGSIERQIESRAR